MRGRTKRRKREWAEKEERKKIEREKKNRDNTRYKTQAESNE